MKRLAFLIFLVVSCIAVQARDSWTQPATQPSGKPDPGAPTSQNPPNITKVTTARQIRVMFDYNPTPIYGPNPKFLKGSPEPDKSGEYAWNRVSDSSEYMFKLGFEPSFMVYNGTLNRSQIWFDKTKDEFRLDLKPAFNRLDLDYSFEGNHSDPVTPEGARACGFLSRNPWVFGAKLQPYRAISIDIEGTKTYNFEVNSFDSAMQQIHAWTDMFKEFRKTTNSTELYSYFLQGYYSSFKKVLPNLTAEQDAEMKQADADMMHLLSGIHACFYNWDVPTENPGLWFAQVDQAAGQIETDYPWMKYNRWAVITPTYQIYWPQSMQDWGNRAKAEKPVDMATWQRQIKYLVDRGWHIYIWNPGDLKTSKPYLDFVAKYSN